MNEEKIAVCGHCGSSNVYGISRVVGYYSKINNWNKSKSAEFRARQNGNYKIVELQKSLNKFAQSESIVCPAKN
jgi:hypothetical protein